MAPSARAITSIGGVANCQCQYISQFLATRCESYAHGEASNALLNGAVGINLGAFVSELDQYNFPVSTKPRRGRKTGK
jgi:hypothetical protein